MTAHQRLQRLLDIVVDGPRTEDDRKAVDDLATRDQTLHNALRDALAADPIPHKLREGRERQYTPGHHPAPQVPVHYVIVGGARAGQVQEDGDGRWQCYYYADAPGETSVGYARHPSRGTREDAALDVLADLARDPRA